MNLFGIEITIIGSYDLHDELNLEDADERDQVDRTCHDYAEYEYLNHETGEETTWVLLFLLSNIGGRDRSQSTGLGITSRPVHSF